ncbi:hypothetical protein PQX77_003937 [Marasmius sp. AFHP31]|nr:hypothetical protein PQX77_003937 [Marasmius sp. AFHP31]
MSIPNTPNTYLSPLLGYENAPPLPTGVNADGKSLVNLPPGQENSPLSKAYDEFVDPLDKKNNGFDFHASHLSVLGQSHWTAPYRNVRSEHLQPTSDGHSIFVADHISRSLFGSDPPKHWECVERSYGIDVMDWEALAAANGFLESVAF